MKKTKKSIGKVSALSISLRTSFSAQLKNVYGVDNLNEVNKKIANKSRDFSTMARCIFLHIIHMSVVNFI